MWKQERSLFDPYRHHVPLDQSETAGVAWLDILQQLPSSWNPRLVTPTIVRLPRRFRYCYSSLKVPFLCETVKLLQMGS